MNTAIGGGFATPAHRRLAVAAGLTAVAADLTLVGTRLDWRYPEARWAVALASLAVLAGASGDARTLGLVARPAGGWGWWARTGLLAGAGVGLVIATAAVVWHASGRPLPLVVTPPAALGDAILRMAVVAPLLEETTYRVALGVAVTAASGPRAAVAASGAAFGMLHVLYGNPSPENLVGGYVLAWAYLRSGTVVVPVCLHAAGNLVVLAGQVAVWWWTGP